MYVLRSVSVAFAKYLFGMMKMHLESYPIWNRCALPHLHIMQLCVFYRQIHVHVLYVLYVYTFTNCDVYVYSLRHVQKTAQITFVGNLVLQVSCVQPGSVGTSFCPFESDIAVGMCVVHIVNCMQSHPNAEVPFAIIKGCDAFA